MTFVINLSEQIKIINLLHNLSFLKIEHKIIKITCANRNNLISDFDPFLLYGFNFIN